MDRNKERNGGIELLEDDFDPKSGVEGITKWTYRVKEKLNELIKRGDGDNPDERANVTKMIEDLQKDLEKVRDMAASGARNVPGGDGQGLNGVTNLRLSGDPPKGMSALHFNLINSQPDELCYAAQFARQTYPGLTAAGERWAKKYGMNDEWRARMLELQALNDLMIVADIAMYGRGDTEYANIGESRTRRLQSTRLWKDWEKLTKEFQRAGAMDTATAGEGGNWVPTILSAQLIELIQAQLVIAPLFSRTPMPSPTYDLPIMGADSIAYKIGENTSDTGQTAITSSVFTTNKVTLSAVKLAARIIASSEVQEDTAVGMVPIILRQGAKSVARAIDDALLNGDTTATHQDADVTAADDRRKAWKGLRNLALASTTTNVKTDAGNAQITVAQLLGMKGAMGIHGVRPSSGVWITGFKSLHELMQAKDGADNEVFLTLDKFGPSFVALTGQLGVVLGSPVVLSEFQREDLGAAGVNTAPTDDRGSVIYADRDSFTLGERRAVTIGRSDERFIEFDQTVFVTTWRGDFKEYYPSEEGVGILYNTR